jgi:hypothetical protein
METITLRPRTRGRSDRDVIIDGQPTDLWVMACHRNRDQWYELWKGGRVVRIYDVGNGTYDVAGGRCLARRPTLAKLRTSLEEWRKSNSEKD